MDFELLMKGALATFPEERFPEASLEDLLVQRELSAEDSRLAIERAILEAWVEREPGGDLRKLDRGLRDAVLGNLAST